MGHLSDKRWVFSWPIKRIEDTVIRTFDVEGTWEGDAIAGPTPALEANQLA